MLYIIIPVFNRIDHTIRCIDSILLQELESDFRIVISDSGSTDNTATIVRDKYSDVDIVFGNSDMFWSSAINLGLKHIEQYLRRDDLVCFMNNDVVLHDNCLQILFENVDGKTICTALSQDERGVVVGSGSVVKSWILAYTHHPFRGEKSELVCENQRVSIDMFTARCVMFSAELYLCNGGIDDKNFPHYSGDDYYSVLAKKSGWSIVLLTSARLTLDNKSNKNDEKTTFAKKLFFHIFDIRSSLNFRKLIQWSLKAPPFYARPTHLVISMVKSFIVFMVQK